MKPPEGKIPLRNLDVAEADFYGFLIMDGVSMGQLIAFQGDAHVLLPLYGVPGRSSCSPYPDSAWSEDGPGSAGAVRCAAYTSAAPALFTRF